MQNLKNIIIFAVLALIIAGVGLFFFSPKNTTTSTKQTNNQQVTSPAGQVIQGQGTLSITPGQTNEQTITLSSSGFTPVTLTVKAGTKVTWINQSGALGDVDSDPHPAHTSYPPMNFGTFGNGSSVSLVFSTPGTYHYHNHLHPTQQGTIIVQ